MHHFPVIIMLLFTIPQTSVAEWVVVTHTNTDDNLQIKVAHTENKENYALEIYRDAHGAIRSRLSMNNNLNRLNDKYCPTYQVDKRSLENRSINDAPCLAHPQWSEFILGYIIDKEVTSTLLHNLMNGNTITYRFIMDNDGYAETSFSLAGSKRRMLEALGQDLVVHTEGSAAN